MRAAGIQVQRLDGAQELGHAQLQQRVGKLQIAGVFGHGLRQFVIRHAGKKQHPRIVEKMAQMGLRVAHRPLLKDVAQAPTGGGRHPGRHSLQARTVLLDEAA